MIASKVSITPETRAKLDNQALSPQRRRELREQMVIERIRNTAGHACTKQELIAAAGFNPDAKTNEYANGITLLASMMKRGLISNDGAKKFRKVWSVIEDVKVKPSAKEVAEAVVAPQPVVVELQDYKQLNKMELKEMAREFAWNKNSDSLREFIAYIENAIK